MTIFIAIVVTTPAPKKGSDLHSHLLFHLPHTEIKSYVCILGQYYTFSFLFRILVDVIFMGNRMPSLSHGRWYRTIFSEYRDADDKQWLLHSWLPYLQNEWYSYLCESSYHRDKIIHEAPQVGVVPTPLLELVCIDCLHLVACSICHGPITLKRNNRANDQRI